MEQAQIGDATIRYLDVRSSSGSDRPTVLLVHGFPLDHSMWHHQIGPLADHARVICPDLPGFGQSVMRRQEISMPQMADHLAGLLEQLAIDQVVFCGLSMGGYIGWQFWRRHPQRLAGLIACDTRAAADTDLVARARQFSASLVRENGSVSIADDMVQRLFGTEALESLQDEVFAVRAVIEAADPESVAQAQLAMAKRPDATTWLPEITIPTLFVVGEHDSITPPSEMQAMARSVPDSVYRLIQRSGHLPPLENAEEFNRAVVEFLAELV